MKHHFFKLAAALLIASAPTLTTMAETHVNPFLSEYTNKYNIPPFEDIQISDFIPAIKAGIEEQKQNMF
ncbi:MAG: hypothetical protein K2J48_11020, partial [Muribaculaceae bacterium]|nr:hypothetical protein [Muribaculaceae bacterium]